MALYSDRAWKDPAMRQFCDTMAEIELDYQDASEGLPDGSWEMYAQAVAVIRDDEERRIAAAVQRRDEALAQRGLRSTETILDDGAYWVDVVPLV